MQNMPGIGLETDMFVVNPGGTPLHIEDKDQKEFPAGWWRRRSNGLFHGSCRSGRPDQFSHRGLREKQKRWRNGLSSASEN